MRKRKREQGLPGATERDRDLDSGSSAVRVALANDHVRA